MAVRTGADLLGLHGWRRKVQRVRLLLTALTASQLCWRRWFVSKELRLDGMAICNPSVVAHEGRLLVAVRRPSYKLTGKSYRLEPGASLQSTTFLVELNEHLDRVGSQTVDTADVTREVVEARDGLEDPRLFTVKGQLFCMWSGLHLGSKQPPERHDGLNWTPDWSETMNQMVLARLQGNLAVEPRLLPSPQARGREKNWMPFCGETMRFAYYLADAIFVEVRDTGLKVDTRPVARLEKELVGWSGSSQLVPWEQGWLCVVHIALRGLSILGRELPAVYLHRFVQLSADRKVVALSRPFRLLGWGVEFCAGLVVEHSGVVLSFGVGDERAYLARMPRSAVVAMLAQGRRPR